tara:strand:+ start:192 stop:614 length:423 start_codon:yes stop_codon:yes gene_type:complete
MLFERSRYFQWQLPVVFGQQKTEEYLSYVGPLDRYKFYNYPAINFINNNVEKDAKILLWSNDGYYLDRDYLYALQFITHMANGDKLFDKKGVIKELKKFGITHVAMNQNYLRMPLRKILEKNKSLILLYEDDNMVVKALP